MGDYYALMGGSRILNASRVDQSGADDAAVTGWTKTDAIIMAVNIHSGGKDTVAAQYKLRWRDVTDSGSFADLGSTGECKFGATDLTNGGTIAVGGRKCDSQGDTWQTGYEVEGTALSTSIDLALGYETEIHFSVSLADGEDGHQYEFELYDGTNNASKGTIGADITLVAAPVTLTVAEANHLVDDNDGGAITIVQIFTLAMGAAPYHLVDDNDGNPLTITETQPPVELVVAPADHLHDSETIGLTQLHELSPAPIDHLQAAANVSLGQLHILAVAAGDHLQVADNISLAGTTGLEIQPADHLHTAAGVLLSQLHALAVAAAEHIQQSDNITLSGILTLADLDAAHLCIADGVILDQAHSLDTAEAAHLQPVSDGLILQQLAAEAMTATITEYRSLSIRYSLASLSQERTILTA